MPHHPDDILERALSELKSLNIPDPPPELKQDTLQCIQQKMDGDSTDQADEGRHRETTRIAKLSAANGYHDRFAWMPFAACVLLMVGCGWAISFQEMIFSHEIARRIDRDGTTWIFHSDRRTTLAVQFPSQIH